MTSEQRAAIIEARRAFGVVNEDCLMALNRARDLLADTLLAEHWDQDKYEELMGLWGKLIFFSTKTMKLCETWAEEARHQL
jgi:hypothetical protein